MNLQTELWRGGIQGRQPFGAMRPPGRLRTRGAWIWRSHPHGYPEKPQRSGAGFISPQVTTTPPRGYAPDSARIHLASQG